MTSTRTRAERPMPAVDPAAQDLPATAPPAPYEMRQLRTKEDLDAAAELVAHRTGWLTEHRLPRPYTMDAAALYREEWVEAVALIEDGHPVGCLRLQREPSLASWDAERTEPSLLLSLAHSTPGRRTDMVGRLMTLWAQDFADRLGRTWVRCEVSMGEPSCDGSLHLLDHLKDVCGWQFVRSCRDRAGRLLVLLQLPALAQRDLEALIRCTVPLRPDVASTPDEELHR